MKNKRFVGLDTYQVEFNSREEMNDWISKISKNGDKWAYTEIFVNNGLCLEIKKLRVI